MLADVQAVLDDVMASFGDTRVSHCQVRIRELTAGSGSLEGTVLEAATLAAVVAPLSARFPAVRFATDDVRVLRRAAPELLTVGTNRAGFHRQPSRTSERVSEVLNGDVLECLLNEDGWTYARQQDGYLGWLQGAYLTPAPAPPATHIVVEPIALLRAEKERHARIVTRVPGGTKVAASVADDGWASVALVGGQQGWLESGLLRPLAGVPAEEEARRDCLMADARRLIGVPYLWGGTTALGIDCSGFVRLLHRLVGVDLPRDADMQFAAGQAVDPPLRPGDLLFFGRNRERAVTHVGLSLGGWRIIHSSGPNNGVYEDDVEQVDWLKDAYRGARSFIRA